MENRSLIPCPFCGSNDAEIIKGRFYEDMYCVFCNGCGVETNIYDRESDAIAAWNRRTNEIPVGNGENYVFKCK